jgi:hypothetical protein
MSWPRACRKKTTLWIRAWKLFAYYVMLRKSWSQTGSVCLFQVSRIMYFTLTFHNDPTLVEYSSFSFIHCNIV